MGAWGYSAFENDDALDWLAHLEKSDGTSVLMEAFSAVLELECDYIEVRESSIAIAAAEIVAGSIGKVDSSLPEFVRAWIDRHRQEEVNSGIVEKARNAVNLVLANSELQEVWEDSGSPEWKVCVEGLLRRLT